MAYEPTQARRIAAGLCKDCGAERGNSGTTIFCRPCADRKIVLSNARTAGLRKEWAADPLMCNGCGAAKPADRFKLCETCRHRRRQNYHRQGRQARKNRAGTGLCVDCSAPSTHASNYCRVHWLRNSATKYGFERDQYAALWAKLEAQGFRCYYTGVKLVPGVNASLDHRIPRSRGGDPRDMDNCVWCDRLINAFKNDLTDAEFIERCRLVVERLG